jgi:hypothetical protein
LRRLHVKVRHVALGWMGPRIQYAAVPSESHRMDKSLALHVAQCTLSTAFAAAIAHHE